MNRVDVLATLSHYADHVAPVWKALPADVRGEFYTSQDALGHVRDTLGIDARGLPSRRERANLPKRLTIVAAYRDLRRTHRMQRPSVYMQHGNGQTFVGKKHPGHLTLATHHQRVVLHLVPAERCVPWIETGQPVAVVGCPKLDRWHPAQSKPRTDPPTVAIAWHWDAPFLPETRSAWPFYQEALPVLKAMEDAGEIRLMGHGHPLIIDEIIPHYERHGIHYTRSFEDVMREADIYVNDASSTLYEFASLDRPVVVMNCPHYRRDVEHGLRFWANADVGVQVDGPEEVPDAIRYALTDPPEQRAARRRGVQAAYEYTDGQCARRAAEAILGALKQVAYIHTSTE
jgi:hypothetical protein